jgi:His/Glu/Gln/Arg/opine family amino acid ABC transporter permease subunit
VDLAFLLRFLPNLLEGLQVTIELSALAIVASLILGLLAAVGLLSHSRATILLADSYVQLMRNTPLLVQLYLIYFGFSLAGFGLSGFASGLLALSLQNGAYMAEIYRGALQSISLRQREAGKALGMRRRDIFELVELPQAFIKAVPPLGNQFIQIIKDTSIVSAIAVGELMHHGKLLSERTAATYEIFIAVALIYIALTSIVALATRAFERRFAVDF